MPVTGDPDAVVSAIKAQMKEGSLSEAAALKARSFINGISWERQSLMTREAFNNVIMGNKTNSQSV